MTYKDAFTWAAVATQGVAALLWFASTIVKVSATKAAADYEQIDRHGNDGQMVADDDSDIFATMKRQARWNQWAALVTGIGIGLQALAIAL